MRRKQITMDSLVAPSKDQVSCDLSGEAAILNVRAGMYYGLDEVGARAWNLILKSQPAREIKEELLNEYDVEPQRCERDLLALLNDLAGKGLIEITDPCAAQ